ncbi:hypothetical protein ACJJI5_10075 [Microbulbifer sp. EKSA008]|uniref:hypothetical protein n=1 Tax=unclassified Microbulbifer TaxID=2619833 RepID=UPI00403A6976
MQRIIDSLDLSLTYDLSERLVQVQRQPGAKDKQILSFTPKQVKDAKYVMRMWSDSEYTAPGKRDDEDHRASTDEVSRIVDLGIKPREPLNNSEPIW